MSKDKKQNQGRTDLENSVNTCFNELDEQLASLDLLRREHDERFKTKMKTFPVKVMSRRNNPSLYVYKIRTDFKRLSFVGTDCSEAKAMANAIEKVRKAWPKKKPTKAGWADKQSVNDPRLRNNYCVRIPWPKTKTV